MEININREDFLHGLYLVQGVVERRTPQPVLGHVLIDAGKETIALSATDTEVGIRCQVAATVKQPGVVTANARKLYEIARELTGDGVTLKTAGSGWVDLQCGRSKFRIVGLDPKDFPELPLGPGEKETSFKIAGGTLREMVDKTLFAVSSDETRLNLSGVYLESSESGLRMVATDGHRLAMIERSVSGTKLPRGVILPRKGLVEVRKLLEQSEDAELTLVVGEKSARIQSDDVAFFMRLVEGDFPDYHQVIPSNVRSTARMNREDLHGALRRAALLASERSHGIRLSLQKGTLEVAASNPEQGEATEEVEVSYAGQPVTIGFNARYLLDVLAVHAVGDVIEFGFTDEVGPSILRASQDPNFTYVLMPMRL